MEELTRKLEMLFNDETGAASVMCSTVHKAKGLEADRVPCWRIRSRVGVGEENIGMWHIPGRVRAVSGVIIERGQQ